MFKAEAHQPEKKGKNWDATSGVEVYSGSKSRGKKYMSLSVEEIELMFEVKNEKWTSINTSNEAPRLPTTRHKKSRSQSEELDPKLRQSIKEEKFRRVSMHDASTQTTNDVSTQTSDEERVEVVRENSKIVSIFGVKTTNASTGMEAGAFAEKLKSLSIGVQTIGEAISGKVLARSPENIFTDLDDLENEIAKIRYKALSLKESIEWIEREKNSIKRPVCHTVKDDDPELSTRDKDSQFAFLPVGARTPPPLKKHTKIKDKRAISVPVVLSHPIRDENNSYLDQTLRVGPDQTKKGLRISESTVFSKPVCAKLGSKHIRRQSKSLNDLPPLNITFQDNKYIVEPAKVENSQSSTNS